MTDEQFTAIKRQMARDYYYTPSQERDVPSSNATAQTDDMHDPLAETDPEEFF